MFLYLYTSISLSTKYWAINTSLLLIGQYHSKTNKKQLYKKLFEKNYMKKGMRFSGPDSQHIVWGLLA